MVLSAGCEDVAGVPRWPVFVSVAEPLLVVGMSLLRAPQQVGELGLRQGRCRIRQGTAVSGGVPGLIDAQLRTVGQSERCEETPSLVRHWLCELHAPVLQ